MAQETSLGLKRVLGLREDLEGPIPINTFNSTIYDELVQLQQDIDEQFVRLNQAHAPGHPSLSLNGSMVELVLKGQEYVEPGFVSDAPVATSNNVDVNKPGTYQVMYTATNATGASTLRTRGVLVYEVIAP